MNPIFVWTIEFRELFGKDVHWEVGKLKRQRYYFLSFRVAELNDCYSKHSLIFACSAYICLYILLILIADKIMQKHRDQIVKGRRREKLMQILQTRR